MPTQIDFDAGASQQNAFRQFTDWAPWEGRENTLDEWGYHIHEYGGVYLLAHFEAPPPEGPADYLSPEVIYVGEGAWFRRRWKQFERSAFKGLFGHSGGNTYREAFAHRQPRPDLYVAAFPVWFGDGVRRSMEDWTAAYRLHVERRLIWEITRHRGGQHGLLNKK